MPTIDRSSGPIEGVLTSTSGFQIVVNEAPTPNLSVFRGITDQFIEANQSTRFSLPPDTFAHTKTDATVTIVAKLADGRDLPSWIEFDARSGTFQMSAPPGLNDDIQVKVTASDSEGRDATVIFKLTIGDGKSKLLSRNGFSEQIMLAAKRPSFWLDLARVSDSKVTPRDAVMTEKIKGQRTTPTLQQTQA